MLRHSESVEAIAKQPVGLVEEERVTVMREAATGRTITQRVTDRMN